MCELTYYLMAEYLGVANTVNTAIWMLPATLCVVSAFNALAPYASCVIWSMLSVFLVVSVKAFLWDTSLPALRCMPPHSNDWLRQCVWYVIYTVVLILT